MKKNLILLFCLLSFFTNNSFAQGLLKKMAENNFDKYYFKDALDQNLELIKNDSTNLEIQKKIGICYRKINDSKNAEIWFAKVVKAWKIEPEYKLYYAEALAENKKYEESKKWYLAYAADRVTDSRGNSFALAYSQINKFYIDSSAYKISTVIFNSDQLDFSPEIYRDGIVFCSNRSTSSLIKNAFAWDYTNYLDLYFVKNGSEKAEKLAGDINTKYHEGPISFNKTMDTAVFTRTNYYMDKLGQDTAGTHKLKLYLAVLKNGEWEDIGGLPFNSDNFSVGHPCFSPDYKKLYFVSDAPGGYGGTDIYVADYKHGTWGTPVNLGKNINSEGNEMFPYMDSLNILFYSSEGLPGLGGLDIFYSKLIDTTFQKAINIGAPLNSSKDDFGIIFSKSMSEGYFTSNRKTAGDDDIYSFKILKLLKQQYKVLVKDSITGDLLVSAITLTDLQTGVKQNLNSDKGTYDLELYPDHPYSIDAGANGYLPKSKIKYFPLTDPNPFEIKLAPIMSYTGFVFEKADTQPPIDSAFIIITNEKNDKVCESYWTAVNGKYTTCKLTPDHVYTITAYKPGFFTNSIIVDTLPPDGKIENIYLEKIEIGKAIVIEKIYFDFDQSYIRADAAIQLDKIVTMLKENPDIIIELGSHTDCRGSYEYNIGLSDRRAKSSVAYIVSKGIPSYRITGKGYGETQLIENCPCEGAVISTCSEAEHQLNRRTEFKVTGYVKGIGNVNMNTAH
jgi:outer membrane protein OmpA-like peptidoglycan-associated protein/tetratricopeptide (TPR) repeat protein